MRETLVQIFPYAIALTIPLLITALGALYCERSGVINIGLDGFMIIGSFSRALTIVSVEKFFPGSNLAVWLGLLVSLIVGGIFSLLHAFASINLSANQVISGTAINMMAGSLTLFLARNITGSGTIRVQGFTKFDMPVHSNSNYRGSIL